MIQYLVQQDKVYSLGEVPYLGVLASNIESGAVPTLPTDYDGWFPFMRMCYSLGDLGITSGIFEALKKKYPKIKIAWPSNEYIHNMIGERKLSTWGYAGKTTWQGNIDAIMRNNPYIDKIFEIGEFTNIFTDHDRSYTSLVHDGEMMRSCDEPLAEQILRRFGFTNDDFKNIDCKPKIYFSEEEAELIQTKLEGLVGASEYGCLLLASRFKTDSWEGEEHLVSYATKYKGVPTFYFSERDLIGTPWANLFPNLINFATLGLTIREQIYIKQRALFNIGYQAGITDASSGKGSDVIMLCPYNTIRENCIRGTRYIFSDGSTKIG